MQTISLEHEPIRVISGDVYEVGSTICKFSTRSEKERYKAEWVFAVEFMKAVWENLALNGYVLENVISKDATKSNATRRQLGILNKSYQEICVKHELAMRPKGIDINLFSPERRACLARSAAWLLDSEYRGGRKFILHWQKDGVAVISATDQVAFEDWDWDVGASGFRSHLRMILGDLGRRGNDVKLETFIGYMVGESPFYILRNHSHDLHS
jgi:hypothetical protein